MLIHNIAAFTLHVQVAQLSSLLVMKAILGVICCLLSGIAKCWTMTTARSDMSVLGGAAADVHHRAHPPHPEAQPLDQAAFEDSNRCRPLPMSQPARAER